MKQPFKLLLCVLLALSATCCNSKSVPQKSPVDAEQSTKKKDGIDSLIKSSLSHIQTNDSNACEELQVEVIRLSQALYDCQLDNDACATALVEKPTTVIDKRRSKVKNSFNDITKNSNNQTEVYNLKKSLLVKGDSIACLQADKIALNGKIKDLTKNKNSNSGSGSNTAKSGNTTNKGSPWPWILLGAAGWFIIQNVGFRALKIYFPFLKFLP